MSKLWIISSYVVLFLVVILPKRIMYEDEESYDTKLKWFDYVFPNEDQDDAVIRIEVRV